MNKKVSMALRLLLVAVIVSVVVYTFRDLGPSIWAELVRTPGRVIGAILLASFLYEVVEGTITTVLSKVYHPGFSPLSGIGCAFFASFYRLATLGTGSGAAVVVYLHDRGVEYSKATGMYALQYAFHRIGIALFAGIFSLLNLGFLRVHYASYRLAMVGGFALTTGISALIFFFCLSRRAHRLILGIIGYFNKNGRLDSFALSLREEVQLFEEGSKDLFQEKRRVAAILGLNLLKQAFWCMIPWLVLGGGGGLTLSQCLMLTSLSVTLATVIPSPAGIGSSEFVLISLYAVLLGGGRAGSVALLYRFATFVFPFAAGIPVALHQRLRQHST